MPRVDFYLLEQQTSQAIFPFVCRLLEKIYRQGEKVFVACNTLEECSTLNRLIWTFNDISFVPHCMAGEPVANETPIILGLGSDLKNHSLLLNLMHQIPAEIDNLTRIMEVVPDEENFRLASRKKYADYKTLNCELHTHKIQ